MLTIHGSKKTLCDGLTRRDLLHVGGAGVLGLGLSDLYRAEASKATSAAEGGGKARACILLFLFGSPPQHETFDPKPQAPAEVQGEMKAIPTSIPGYQICEGLPLTARVVDRTTVVRSMTHPYPLHCVAYALSGLPTYSVELETRPRDVQHWPFLGSVVDYLERNASSRTPAVPANIGLPWQFGSKSDLPQLAGPYAAFLGSGYDPLWTDFSGGGTSVVPKLSDGQSQVIRDPFGGVEQSGRFQLSPACQLPDDVTRRRLDTRRLLLEQFDRTRPYLERTLSARTLDQHQQRAWSLITSGGVRSALDIQREPLAVRERYGMSLFGQSCLAARRLVEAGCRFVSVFWDPFGLYGGSVWDTHANHFPRLKDYLLPVFDQSYASLILDLEERGLLDETLVLCMSEHGRTPKIDSKPKGAGRHHWSRVYSAIYAGGGMARGKVVGRSDSIGSDVADTPISPKDIQATTYHLLGFGPHTMMRDQLGRPVPIAGDGSVRPELLA